MSTKAVIIWLVLAVALGVTAIVLLNSPTLLGSGSENVAIGSKLLHFSPGDVREIAVARADGSKEIIEKAPNALSSVGSDAEWQLRIQPAKSTDYTPPPWPVSGPQMQSLLRILTDLSATAIPAKDATLGERPLAVTIGLADKTERTFHLADRALAGTCLAEVSETAAVPAQNGQPARPALPKTRALVDAKVYDLFTNPGPRAWRETAVMASMGADASRIRLENARQKLVLGKSDGRWFLREPVAAPADQTAVQGLLAELSRVHIADFLDSGTASASTGLEKPDARLGVEVDKRSFAPGATEPTTATISCEIAIGRPADATGGRVFASVNDERIVLIDAAGLARITMDPTTYIWPHPTRLAAADIGAIVLDRTDTPSAPGSKAFKRSLSRWSQIKPDGSEITLADKELRDADALATFLTGGERGAFAGNANTPTRDERPTITIEPPDSLRIVGRIVLLSIGGDPLETLEVGVARPGQAVLRTGTVYREFLVGKLPALLNDLINAAPPSAPAAADKKPDINK